MFFSTATFLLINLTAKTVELYAGEVSVSDKDFLHPCSKDMLRQSQKLIT